jgi:hypothetical protein
MKPEQAIKEHVRNNSWAIHELKEAAIGSAHGYMCPAHSEWEEYQGRKREVTKWLIALHLCRGNKKKVWSHTKSEDNIRIAWKAIAALTEKLRKEAVCA